MTQRVIVYHANCHDGITALWAALQVWPDAEEYPARHGYEPDLDRLRDRDVVVVDFSWPREQLLAAAGVAHSFHVLDHHVTAQDALADLDGRVIARDDGHTYRLQVMFDMERSGAGLAWDELVGGERPWMVNYVEDRDLWRFALPLSREVHAACNAYPNTLAMRDWLATRDLEDVQREGVAILRYHNKLVKSAVQYARTISIGGYDVPAVQCPTIELVSDIGHALAKDAPFAAVWFELWNGTRVFSLRSTDDGMDVGAIAVEYGGGGHKHASGFKLKPGEEL